MLFIFIINSPQSENPRSQLLCLVFLSIPIHLAVSFTSLYCGAIPFSTPFILSKE